MIIVYELHNIVSINVYETISCVIAYIMCEINLCCVRVSITRYEIVKSVIVDNDNRVPYWLNSLLLLNYSCLVNTVLLNNLTVDDSEC